MDEHRGITLIHNIGGLQHGDLCTFCNREVELDGFDFIAEWKEGDKIPAVCSNCAKEIAPAIYQIWAEAHAWHEGKCCCEVFDESECKGFVGCFPNGK